MNGGPEWWGKKRHCLYLQKYSVTVSSELPLVSRVNTNEQHLNEQCLCKQNLGRKHNNSFLLHSNYICYLISHLQYLYELSLFLRGENRLKEAQWLVRDSSPELKFEAKAVDVNLYSFCLITSNLWRHLLCVCFTFLYLSNVTHNVTLVSKCTTQWFNMYTPRSMFMFTAGVAAVPHHTTCSPVVDCVSHAAPFTPAAYSSPRWRFVSPTPLHQFSPCPALSLWQPSICSLCL